MASKLTDPSKFKVTVKSDTDIPAIVFFVCFFVCFVLFIFFLSYFFIYCFLFFFFFLCVLFVFFCFFSLIYVHVTVYTYKPGHSILRPLDKSV